MRKNKKGFSLVEVMVLLVVFSIFLAASMSAVSRKTRGGGIESEINGSNNVAHGTYRCIPTGNGKFLEEIYNSKRLIKSSTVSECKFKVPEANKYIVDMYSAGAGGTKFAQYVAKESTPKVYGGRGRVLPQYRQQKENEVVVTLDDIWAYNNGGTLPFETSGGIKPTNENLKQLLGGLTLATSNIMSSGANGGLATFRSASLGMTNCYSIYKDYGWGTNLPVLFSYTNDPKYNGDGYLSMVYQFDLNGNVAKAYNEYCKDKSMNDDHNYYGLNPLDQSSPYAVADPPPFYKGLPSDNYTQQNGGKGGKGSYSWLEYSVQFSDAVANSYKNKRYPILNYLADITDPNKSGSYAPLKCDKNKNYGNKPLTNDCSIGYAINASYEIFANPASYDIYDPTRNISNPFASDEWKTTHLLKAEDGKPLKYVPGFRVPATDSNAIWAPRAIILGTANNYHISTGGKGGRVTIEFPLIDNYVIGSKDYINVEKYALRTYLGERGTDTFNKIEAEKGEDGWFGGHTMHGSNVWYQTEYKKDKPMFLKPELHMTSRLWQKQYVLGKSGSPGQYKRYQVTTLGTNCTIKPPQAGPVIDMTKSGKYAGYKAQEEANNLEKNLAATIVCYDKDKNVTFSQSLAGGKYDVTIPTDWEYTFNWDETYNQLTKPFIIKYTDKHPLEKSPLEKNGELSSKWSKVYSKMKKLADYNIGKAGEGSTLTDRCVAAKGEYEISRHLILTEWTNYEKILTGEETVPQESTIDVTNNNSFSRFMNTTKSSISDQNEGVSDTDNFKCYMNENGEDVNGGTRVVGGENDKRGELYYYEVTAGAGGPGAIVITW